MQRDFFLSQLISDRGVPSVALPAHVIVTHGDILDDHRYECAGLTEQSLPRLCQRLRDVGTRATHLQLWDRRDGRRQAAIFMEIASTAAWHEPKHSTRRT